MSEFQHMTTSFFFHNPYNYRIVQTSMFCFEITIHADGTTMDQM